MSWCASASSQSASREVANRAEEDALVASLRDYARQRVAESREAILANLRSKTDALPLVLDIGFPGAAYFSVACGGLAEVLHLLGEDVVQVDRFSGGSGGACSLFLILANQETSGKGPARCPNSEVLLHSYLQYGESTGGSVFQRLLDAGAQSFGVSSFWERRYRELLQNDANWEAIRERAFCAVSARPVMRNVWKGTRKIIGHGEDRVQQAPSDNYLFHDFSSKEQAVHAFIATGEATAKGMWSGINVVSPPDPNAPRERAVDRGLDRPLACSFLGLGSTAGSGNHLGQLTLPKTFCDGGHPVVFASLPGKVCPSAQQARSPKEESKNQNWFLYYHTFFDNNMTDAAIVTKDGVERLFKRGVETTIDCLSSPDLFGPRSLNGKVGSEKMAVVGHTVDVLTEIQKVGIPAKADGVFVSLRKGEAFEVGQGAAAFMK